MVLFPLHWGGVIPDASALLGGSPFVNLAADLDSYPDVTVPMGDSAMSDKLVDANFNFKVELETLIDSGKVDLSGVPMEVASTPGNSDMTFPPDFSDLSMSDVLSADNQMDLLGDDDIADNPAPLSSLVGCNRPKYSNKTLCATCQVNKKEYRKSERGPCYSIIGLAVRHAHRQGLQPVAALRQLRRTAGEVWTKALAELKDSACGYGRGSRLAQFDWMAFATKAGVVSKVETADTMEWLTLFSWREHMRIRYGKSQAASDTGFGTKLEVVPRSRVAKSADGSE